MKRLRMLSISLGRRGGFPLYGCEMTRALCDICDVGAVYAAGADNVADWRELACDSLEIETYGGVVSGALSFFNFPKFFRIKRFIDRFAPDVVYYPGGHFWKPAIDRVLPRGVPVVMTVHDPVIHPGDESLMLKIMMAIDTRKPDGFVLLNDRQREAYARAHGIEERHITVIPHGVFSGYVHSLVPMASLPGLGDIERRRYFLCLGRIVRYKGIATLLRAYRSIVADTEMDLVIAGSGEFSDDERTLIDRLPPERVKVINRWLSDEEVATLTEGAYMTTMPYEGATQSGVIPAASAFGTPSIASDSGGLAEQVVDGVTGMIFRAGSADELAAAMKSASEMSADRYDEMRRAVRAYADENWSWRVLAQKLAAFCATIADDKITPRR